MADEASQISLDISYASELEGVLRAAWFQNHTIDLQDAYRSGAEHPTESELTKQLRQAHSQLLESYPQEETEEEDE